MDPEIQLIIDRALSEDLQGGDVTTRALIRDAFHGDASFISEESGVLSGLVGLAFFVWFNNSTTIPIQFVYFTPHLTTLIVLSFASQKFRMPKSVGKPYKKGELS